MSPVVQVVDWRGLSGYVASRTDQPIHPWSIALGGYRSRVGVWKPEKRNCFGRGPPWMRLPDIIDRVELHAANCSPALPVPILGCADCVFFA